MIHQLAGIIGSSQVIAAAGHRYWRINVTANNGGSNLQIAEIEMMDTVSGSDIIATHTSATASTGTITGSSEYSATYTPWKACSENFTTDRWISNNVQTGWLKYDFNTPYPDILEYTITAFANNTVTPKNWTLQWSDNNSDWNTVHTVTNKTTWTAGSPTTFTV